MQQLLTQGDEYSPFSPFKLEINEPAAYPASQGLSYETWIKKSFVDCVFNKSDIGCNLENGTKRDFAIVSTTYCNIGRQGVSTRGHLAVNKNAVLYNVYIKVRIRKTYRAFCRTSGETVHTEIHLFLPWLCWFFLGVISTLLRHTFVAQTKTAPSTILSGPCR